MALLQSNVQLLLGYIQRRGYETVVVIVFTYKALCLLAHVTVCGILNVVLSFIANYLSRIYLICLHIGEHV